MKTNGNWIFNGIMTPICFVFYSKLYIIIFDRLFVFDVTCVHHILSITEYLILRLNIMHSFVQY